MLHAAALAPQQTVPLHMSVSQQSLLEPQPACVLAHVPALHWPPLQTRPLQQSLARMQLPLDLHVAGLQRPLLSQLKPAQQSDDVVQLCDIAPQLVAATQTPSVPQLRSGGQIAGVTRQSGRQAPRSR
jgi:hypothetical protein